MCTISTSANRCIGAKALILGASTYIEWQFNATFVRHCGYRRTDDLLPKIRSCNGTSNALVEVDNEDTDKEEDAAEEEEAADAVDISKLNLDPI